MEFLWKMPISLLVPAIIWTNYHFKIKESYEQTYTFLVHFVKRYLFYSAFLVILPFIYIEYQNMRGSDQVMQDSKAIVTAFFILVTSMFFKEIIQLAKGMHNLSKETPQILNRQPQNAEQFQFQKQYSTRLISDSKCIPNGTDEVMRVLSYLNHQKQMEPINNNSNISHQGDLLDKLKITKSSQVGLEDGMLFSSKYQQDQFKQLEIARHKPINQAIFTIQEQQEYAESQIRFVDSINMDQLFSCVYSIEIISYSLAYGFVIGQSKILADSIFYCITMVCCIIYKFLEIKQIETKRNQIVLILMSVMVQQLAIYIGSIIDHQLLAICLKAYVAGYSIIQFTENNESLSIKLTIANSLISILLLSIFVIVKIY